MLDSPEKPVFVLQHEHIRDTVYGSYTLDGRGEIYFTDIIKKYPNVFHISGHSHYPASDPRVLRQGDFTALNVGGLSYYEFTFDRERKYHPKTRKAWRRAR
ncbi:MAG: metallophosphoesterase [Clostridia bacterium]|nr:metallophosphoesterase [Clostridia bacterium]